MTAILIFIAIVIGLNLIPQLTKKKFPKTEKAVTQILILTTGTFLILTILLFNGFKLKGLYSNPIVGVAFILTSLFYFAAVKNTKRKILSVFLLTPLILLSLFTLLFGRKIYEQKIADNIKIEVSTGGILACGELIHITETKFGIFDKEIYYESSLCLREIEQIKTIKFDKVSAEFLIYHDGEMDSENPYHYKIENKNVW
jgi:hypothetical protein